jgi:hypothetical protein
MPSLGDILSAALTGHSQGDVNDAYALKAAQVQDTLAQVPLRGAQTQEALANADAARKKALAADAEAAARNKQEDALIQAGVEPHQAHLLANASAAGYGNFSEVTKGANNLQEHDFRQTLGDATAPPEARLAAQSGVEGKVASPYAPLPLVSTDLRNVAPAGKAPNALISPLGDASINAKDAAAANANANAAKTKLASSGAFSESRAQLIAAGKAPYPSPYEFTRSPTEAQALSDRVMELNKDFSATDLPQAQATMLAFSKGQPAQRVTALNASTQHLQSIRDLIKALDNGDMPAINAIVNFTAQQTGDSAPTNLAEAGQFVGTELMKALVVSGAGSAAEREKLTNDFANARSTKQLNDAAKTAEALLSGQALALEKQYRGGRGMGDFRKLKLLPETRQALGLTDPSPTDDTAPTPGAHPIAGAPAISGAAPSVAAITPPPAPALVGMVEGSKRTFKNGQTWTIKNGKPVQVF